MTLSPTMARRAILNILFFQLGYLLASSNEAKETPCGTTGLPAGCLEERDCALCGHVI
ncbi:hypothetical protein MPC4_200040 [Methylocella tundrae]|uniref:Uncharacterized protein n=1 Tax=Methylocella tundrae TaxID=227605 RepID=A0A8B6M5P9_METTU|nr:hypothetical protein MPC4_200040 [Methylocella tundrae]